MIPETMIDFFCEWPDVSLKKLLNKLEDFFIIIEWPEVYLKNLLLASFEVSLANLMLSR